MKNLPVFSVFLIIIFSQCNNRNTPLSLHPDNPHYFIFRGEPTVLIGSTEHYGAVLNLDFDYIKYLDEVAASNLNVTRTFTGIYLEPQGAFGIDRNSMAPASGRSICPWARSSEPGYALGGNKFDLDKWDEKYFNRLKDFISEAGKRDIVVELDLFSNFYDTMQWKLSPVHYNNNINNVPVINDQKEILSLRHPEILAIQEKMVRKIILELNEFDNLYYEVCNEPYFGDIDALNAWEKYMTAVAVDAEKDLPNIHLISNNIGNGTVKVDKPNDGVSVLNFHYAKPPESVALNYDFNMVIGDNETGFRGIEDVHYRTEAWDFMTAGGGLYNNLDYSFTVGNEDGTFVVAPGQPGGGGKALRNQLKILAEVFDELDFISMKSDQSIPGLVTDQRTSVRALAGEDEFLIYIHREISNSNNYSLRFNGSITAPVSGKYRFFTTSDDGVRLWIDDRLLIENWNDHAAVLDSAEINLIAARNYKFKLEYYQGGGGLSLGVQWVIPGSASKQQITGVTALDGKTPGYLVERFTGTDLKKEIVEGIVTQITPDVLLLEADADDQSVDFIMHLEKGSYHGQWIDTKTGSRSELDFSHDGGEAKLSTPAFNEDVALILRKK